MTNTMDSLNELEAVILERDVACDILEYYVEIPEDRTYDSAILWLNIDMYPYGYSDNYRDGYWIYFHTSPVG